MVEYPADWKVGKVSDFYEVGSSKRVFQSDWRTFGIPFYRARELVEFNKTGKCNNDLYIDESLYSELRTKYGVPSIGDMLVTGVGTLGTTYVVRDDAPFYFKDGNIIWFRKRGGYDTDFLQYLYAYVEVKNQIEDASGGSTVGTYTIGNAARTVIPVPPLPEQKRIAAVLSNADKLIANVEKQIAKKRAIKQGAMQELLTGKKRLSGFSGDWKKKTLGSSATVKARIGWQGLTTAEYLKDGDHYLVNGVNIENGQVNWQTCFMVDEKRYAQDKNIQLQNFDVLVSKDGTIGKVAYVENMPRTATLNSGVFVVRSIDAELSQEYLARVFLSMWFDDFIEKITAGSTIVHLYQKDIVQFTFQVPPSLAEQRTIAKVLSGMDAEIANLERKLKKLKLMKQGMMQDLLTGKVRLK